MRSQLKRVLLFTSVALMSASQSVFGSPDVGPLADSAISMQKSDSTPVVAYRYFVGTSAWSIANVFPDPADFYQLDFGLEINSKDALIVEAITWKYSIPLGIPYWSSCYGEKRKAYPGYVRAFGIGLDYRRMLWGNVFGMIQVTPFLQNFYRPDGAYITTGLQTFLQARIGYHAVFYHKRFFIDPSIALNWWPVNTGFPDGFESVEKTWPNYFLIEPGLNIGYRF